MRSVNPVMGRNVEAELITTGTVIFDAATGRYTDFVATDPDDPLSLFDGVLVRASLKDDTALESVLGIILGYDHYDLTAASVAVLPPRDFVICYDESWSMLWDSALTHVDRMIRLRENGFPNARINLREIWGAFAFADGIYDPAYDPTVPGFRYGTFMTLPEIPNDGYGTDDADIIDRSYRPQEDPGLIHLPPSAWDDATMVKLGAKRPDGSSTGLLKDRSDVPLTLEQLGWLQGLIAIGDNWKKAVGVALGLYNWTPNPPVPGFPDFTIDDSELSYLYGPSSRLEWIEPWIEAMAGKLEGTSPPMFVPRNEQFGPDYGHGAHDNFFCTYGVKTLVNWLLMKRRTASPWPSGTPHLSRTPQQPAQAVKDAAANFLLNEIGLLADDRIALKSFANEAYHLEDFRPATELTAVLETLQARQAGHETMETNTFAGLKTSIDYLNADARPQADKVVILLTDGKANRTDTTVGDEYAAWVAVMA